MSQSQALEMDIPPEKGVLIMQVLTNLNQISPTSAAACLARIQSGLPGIPAAGPYINPSSAVNLGSIAGKIPQQITNTGSFSGYLLSAVESVGTYFENAVVWTGRSITDLIPKAASSISYIALGAKDAASASLNSAGSALQSTVSYGSYFISQSAGLAGSCCQTAASYGYYLTYHSLKLAGTILKEVGLYGYSSACSLADTAGSVVQHISLSTAKNPLVSKLFTTGAVAITPLVLPVLMHYFSCRGDKSFTDEMAQKINEDNMRNRAVESSKEKIDTKITALQSEVNLLSSSRTNPLIEIGLYTAASLFMLSSVAPAAIAGCAVINAASVLAGRKLSANLTQRRINNLQQFRSNL